jgi:tripartite-type tricarboxylate transporter receptor subunit TctC
VVVNKTGGGGMVGHLYIAKQAAPDGYTIGVVADSFLTDDIVRSKGEWSYKDTKMLAYISFSPLYWITNVESKYASFSLKELVDFAKKNPDTVSIGVVKDMAFEFLVEKVSMITGAKFKIVPFQGGAPGVTSLLGGHIDVTSAYLTEFRSHATAGKVKAIAQAGEKRDPYMSDVPSFNEGLGIKQILEGASRFCAVPKETPADRVAFLEVAIQAALKDPACIKAYNEIGIEVDSRHMNAVQTTKYVEDMYTDLKEFLTKSGRVK